MKENNFKVRDLRDKGWFWLDNDYMNGYGKFFGGNGVSIYMNLCRHADSEQKCFPSQKKIAEELNMGERTVRNYVKLFEKYRLIEITKERSRQGKWLNNTYWLLDKTEWIKPEATIADNKTTGNVALSQRQIATHPEATDNSLRIPIKKNTNKKNTNFFSSKKKPYFWGNPMLFNSIERKWYVIENGEWLEFAGLESNIEWKERP